MDMVGGTARSLKGMYKNELPPSEYCCAAYKQNAHFSKPRAKEMAREGKSGDKGKKKKKLQLSIKRKYKVKKERKLELNLSREIGTEGEKRCGEVKSNIGNELMWRV